MDRNVEDYLDAGTLDRVALRKESVDRNASTPPVPPAGIPSLSARRAWIEMPMWTGEFRAMPVALRKESVDRNTQCELLNPLGKCRSPQGERG